MSVVTTSAATCGSMFSEAALRKAWWDDLSRFPGPQFRETRYLDQSSVAQLLDMLLALIGEGNAQPHIGFYAVVRVSSSY
jgi:hypothetical protein